MFLCIIWDAMLLPDLRAILLRLMPVMGHRGWRRDMEKTDLLGKITLRCGAFAD